MKLILGRTLICVVILLLSACATQQHARDLLATTLFDYAGAMRWNNFAGAAEFLDPQIERKPLALEMKRYEQIQVTGYYVQASQQVSPELVRQAVEIRFVNRHTQAERAVLDHQSWRYDKEQRRWWLTTGLPDITGGR